MSTQFPINLWINDERYEKLQHTGLAHMTEDVLAGMRVLKLLCTEDQKNEILKLFPMAKFDTATTRSIELLPPEVKNTLFDIVLEKKSTLVIEEFLKRCELQQGMI